MTSKDIQRGLYSHYVKHKYHLTNSFIFKWDWETDFFSVSKSGLMYEVEIKISKSDFKRDFDKSKHRIFQYLKGSVKPIMKDPRIDNMKLLPHKFYFATPQNLIKFEELPAYAGLMELGPQGISIIKEAPILHKHKPNIDKILLDKFYYRSMSQREQLESLKHRLDMKDDEK